MEVFGKCPRHGGGGYDADAEEAGSGMRLYEYNGEYLCRLCIEELKDQAHDRMENERFRQDEQFRESAGMTKS